MIETREQAIEYAKMIWQRMAVDGGDKETAIEDLIAEDLLPPDAANWHLECPFCEYSKVLPTGHFKIVTMGCEGKCPWPKYATGGAKFRCDHNPESPYVAWFEAYGTDDHNGMCEAAHHVYEMLCELEA